MPPRPGVLSMKSSKFFRPSRHTIPATSTIKPNTFGPIDRSIPKPTQALPSLEKKSKPPTSFQFTEPPPAQEEEDKTTLAWIEDEELPFFEALRTSNLEMEAKVVELREMMEVLRKNKSGDAEFDDKIAELSDDLLETKALYEMVIKECTPEKIEAL